MKSTLTPVAEALAYLLDEMQPTLATEQLALTSMFDRVLAADVLAAIDVPPQDNSAMDGYALRCTDVVAGKTLPVSQRIQAGHAAQALQAGTVARIFTGAAIPAGADAVVMQEDCGERDGGIEINCAVSPQQHIRPRGQDIACGTTVLRAGQRLHAASVGVIASLGQAQASCYRRLKVAILSTGDELLEPGQDSNIPALAGGAGIFNSNRYSLHSLLQGLGCDVIDGGIVPDDYDASREVIQRLGVQADCIISSGGVSVGEADYIKRVLEELGDLRLWKLAMKPGKPLSYGTVPGSVPLKTPFFGLPGNPAAVIATFLIIVRPCLLKLQGQQGSLMPPAVAARALFDWPKPGSRQEYLRARYSVNESGDWEVDIFSNQSSGVLSSASWANAFVVMPIGATVKAGASVKLLPFDFF